MSELQAIAVKAIYENEFPGLPPDAWEPSEAVDDWIASTEDFVQQALAAIRTAVAERPELLTELGLERAGRMRIQTRQGAMVLTEDGHRWRPNQYEDVPVFRVAGRDEETPDVH